MKEMKCLCKASERFEFKVDEEIYGLCINCSKNVKRAVRVLRLIKQGQELKTSIPKSCEDSGERFCR